MLESHKSAADATQVHAHYLKGTLYCGSCGERLIIIKANNGKGRIYPYFVCNGRHSKKTECTRQAMLIDDSERLVEEYYERIEVSSEVRQALGAMCHAEFDRLLAEDSGELSLWRSGALNWKRRGSLSFELTIRVRSRWSC